MPLESHKQKKVKSSKERHPAEREEEGSSSQRRRCRREKRRKQEFEKERENCTPRQTPGDILHNIAGEDRARKGGKGRSYEKKRSRPSVARGKISTGERASLHRTKEKIREKKRRGEKIAFGFLREERKKICAKRFIELPRQAGRRPLMT